MGQREKLVRAALSQLGTVGGSGYVAWYNGETGSRLGPQAAWCAIFVSWCARQAGLSTAQVPNFAGCTTGRRLLQARRSWREREEWAPQRGDLILFDWDSDPSFSEHVGIVTGRDGSFVYTVEGNSGGAVREKRYPLRSKYILGYGVWEEREEPDLTREETQALIDRALEAAPQPEVYHRVEEVPAWGRPAVEKLVTAGILKGDERGDLALSRDMVRMLVILERKEGGV